MSLLKKLAGETAIYGLSSIIGRVLNLLLVPLYTRVFPESEYGIVAELYAVVGFLMVLFIYRMDTAFFRFGTDKESREKVFSNSIWSVAGTSLLFSLLIFVFSNEIAAWFSFSAGQVVYVKIFGLILGLDTLSEIPLAKLRLENRAKRFAVIRLAGIALNIGFNLFFLLLCPWLLRQGIAAGFVQKVYDPSYGILYIFVSNLIASASVLLLLLPDLLHVKWEFDTRLWKTMFLYAAPLVLASLAGIVNEMLDRVLLVSQLPYDIETNRGQVGVYSACYKLAMLMSLFTQAFRYAAEPFFFANAKNKDAKILYADVTKYFTIVGALGFLAITFYLDFLKYFIDEDYWEGLVVVPILLMANLFLGLYYNVSIWYKLTDRTMIGGLIALGGAAITIVLNILWIPRFGYLGSAWATLICYVSMTLASWWWGRKYYSVKYDLKRIIFYVSLSLLLFCLSDMFQNMPNVNQQIIYVVNTVFIFLFIFITWRLEKDNLTLLA